MRALFAGFNLSFSKIFWDCALEALILAGREGMGRRIDGGRQAGEESKSWTEWMNPAMEWACIFYVFLPRC